MFYLLYCRSLFLLSSSNILFTPRAICTKDEISIISFPFYNNLNKSILLHWIKINFKFRLNLTSNLQIDGKGF